MERLYQAKSIIVTAFLVLAWLPVARAADYCSLTVRVLTPDQKRSAEVWVSVRENSGRVIEKKAIREDVSFCDLGIIPVTVTVGLNSACNQVIVKDVSLNWQTQHVLTVTYDPDQCRPEMPPPPILLCYILLRISDTAGNWIENAKIQSSKFKAQAITDNAGRTFLPLALGETVEGTINASGYESKKFSISCSRSERYRDELIKLEKSSGQ